TSPWELGKRQEGLSIVEHPWWDQWGFSPTAEAANYQNRPRINERRNLPLPSRSYNATILQASLQRHGAPGGVLLTVPMLRKLLIPSRYRIAVAIACTVPEPLLRPMRWGFLPAPLGGRTIAGTMS